MAVNGGKHALAKASGCLLLWMGITVVTFFLVGEMGELQGFGRIIHLTPKNRKRAQVRSSYEKRGEYSHPAWRL